MVPLTIKTIRFKTYESNDWNLTYVNTNKGRKLASFGTYICQFYSTSSDQLIPFGGCGLWRNPLFI